MYQLVEQLRGEVTRLEECCQAYLAQGLLNKFKEAQDMMKDLCPELARLEQTYGLSRSNQTVVVPTSTTHTSVSASGDSDAEDVDATQRFSSPTNCDGNGDSAETLISGPCKGLAETNAQGEFDAKQCELSVTLGESDPVLRTNAGLPPPHSVGSEDDTALKAAAAMNSTPAALCPTPSYSVRSRDDGELEVTVELPHWAKFTNAADLTVDVAHEGSFAVLTIGATAQAGMRLPLPCHVEADSARVRLRRRANALVVRLWPSDQPSDHLQPLDCPPTTQLVSSEPPSALVLNSGRLEQVAVECARYLQEESYVVVDTLLTETVARTLLAEVQAMHVGGQMEKGQVNSGQENSRGDHVRWIDPEDGGDGLQAFTSIVDHLVLALSERMPALARCSLMRDKAMATVYPAHASGCGPKD